MTQEQINLELMRKISEAKEQFKKGRKKKKIE